MRLLIVGAGGFIGLPLAQHLTSAGHEVIGLSRTAPKSFADPLHHVRADRGDAQAVAAAVKSGRIESVVDLLGPTEVATRRVLDALEGHIARYVLVSSGTFTETTAASFARKRPSRSSTLWARRRRSAAAAIPIGEPSPVPANARSLLVVCDDADAFGRSVPILGGYNIPPDWTALERGGFQQAINDFNEPGYAGPCPPRGEKAHAYHFRLAALRTVLNDAGPGANCDAIKRLAAPDEIAFVELIGFYGR